MTEEALRTLIEQWEILADQAREQTRLTNASDLSRVSFHQGVMKTYLSAIQDLRALLHQPEVSSTDRDGDYLVVPEREAAAIVERAGLFARALTLHPDRVFTAVFSRLQRTTQDSRIRQLSGADPRLVIVDQGALRDTGDPFIDFAFRPDETKLDES